VLLHSEGGVRIGDSGHRGRDLDCRGVSRDIDRHGIIRQFRCNAEATQNFDGIDPGFERPTLFAEDGPALSGHCEWLVGFDSPRDGKWIRPERESRDWPQRGRLLGRRGQSGDQDKSQSQQD
jgi:hypothetical protein